MATLKATPKTTKNEKELQQQRTTTTMVLLNQISFGVSIMNSIYTLEKLGQRQLSAKSAAKIDAVQRGFRIKKTQQSRRVINSKHFVRQKTDLKD